LKRRFFLLVAGAGLAACASAPKLSGALAEREALHDFAIEARFALKIERFGEAVQNGSGRLSWAHQNGEDRVFLANPLGSGLAEIEIGQTISRLRSANGVLHENADADLLMQQVTGYPLPVSRLAGWLLGRPGAAGELTRDAFGRPLRLREAGWQIDYLYADETPAALPFRLNINRADEVSLNLRIEEWRDAP
jgi:outer membrane lipoprotein LolB